MTRLATAKEILEAYPPSHPDFTDFNCCGGNDETPKAHTMDCPFQMVSCIESLTKQTKDKPITCPVVMLNCELGLYKIYWKDEAGGIGGASIAAIGNSPNGDRWLAPTNWVSPGMLKDHVHAIARMELLINNRDRHA